MAIELNLKVTGENGDDIMQQLWAFVASRPPRFDVSDIAKPASEIMNAAVAMPEVNEAPDYTLGGTATLTPTKIPDGSINPDLITEPKTKKGRKKKADVVEAEEPKEEALQEAIPESRAAYTLFDHNNVNVGMYAEGAPWLEEFKRFLNNCYSQDMVTKLLGNNISIWNTIITKEPKYAANTLEKLCKARVTAIETTSTVVTEDTPPEELTADDVRAAVDRLIKKKSAEAAYKLFTEYGAENISGAGGKKPLPKDKWAEFINKCEELIEN